jgi:apolipoprotein N-acyltransferase
MPLCTPILSLFIGFLSVLSLAYFYLFILVILNCIYLLSLLKSLQKIDSKHHTFNVILICLFNNLLNACYIIRTIVDTAYILKPQKQK